MSIRQKLRGTNQEQTMKTIKFKICLGLVFVVFFVLLFGSLKAQSSGNENYCFTCHTNAQKLIKLTRMISRSDKAKPGGSAQTAGEG
jgi:hypothetical protein